MLSRLNGDGGVRLPLFNFMNVPWMRSTSMRLLIFNAHVRYGSAPFSKDPTVPALMRLFLLFECRYFPAPDVMMICLVISSDVLIAIGFYLLATKTTSLQSHNLLQTDQARYMI